MPSFRSLAKAPAPATTKANDVVDALDDPKADQMPRIYAKTLDFQVAHNRVMVRSAPSTKAQLVRILPKGQQVSGYLQDRWLHIPGEKPGWILTDGANLGLGLLLEHNMLRIDVKYCFSNALLIAWEKIPARVVEYCVEWAPKDDPSNVTTTNQRETMTLGVRVRELPHETEVILRLKASILTDVREYGGIEFASLTGPWCEAETDREITDIDEENLCCDPLANIRGRCMDCNCDGFVISNYGGARPDARMENIACRRCACPCTRHVIIGEFSYRGSRKTKEAPQAFKQKEISLNEVRKQIAEPIQEITWKPEDAKQGDKVQFVLDKVAQARTLYETLGVPSAADDKDVRSAYRQASLIIHPDKVRGRGDTNLAEEAEAAFKIVTSAYEILGDEMKRVMYDRSLNKYRPSTSVGGTRSSLTGLSFLKRFLSKAGFGYDFNAKPKGDWEQTGPGQWRRSTRANIVVTHAISGETYEASLEKGTPILSLKKRMVKDLKRGPESRIELAGVDGSDRPNSYNLSNSENLILVGINLGDPVDVKVCLCHADTGARVRVTVPDTSTMEEIRQAAAVKLSCELKNVRLGFRTNNAEKFQDFEDTEYLNSREMILILGVDVVPMFTVEEALELQDELIIAYGADWVQQKLDAILEEYGLDGSSSQLDGLIQPGFKEAFKELLSEAQRDTMVKHGFDGPNGVYSMLSAFSEASRSPDVKEKVKEIDKKLRVTWGGGLPPVMQVSIEQAAELEISIVVDRSLADWPIRLTVRQGLTVKALKRRLAADDATQSTSESDFGLSVFYPDYDGRVKQLPDYTQLGPSHCLLQVCDKDEPSMEVEQQPMNKPDAQSGVRSLTVVVFTWSKVRDIKEALAKKIQADVDKINLVSESDTTEGFVSHDDTLEVGSRRKFKILGVQLPEKVEAVQPKAKPASKTAPEKMEPSTTVKNREPSSSLRKGEPLIQEVEQPGQDVPQAQTPKPDLSKSGLPTPSSAPASKAPAGANSNGAAAEPLIEEKRQAEDKSWYTRKEFVQFYGTQEGSRQWIMAERRGVKSAPEKIAQPETKVDVKPLPSKVEEKPPSPSTGDKVPTQQEEVTSATISEDRVEVEKAEKAEKAKKEAEAAEARKKAEEAAKKAAEKKAAAEAAAKKEAEQKAVAQAEAQAKASKPEDVEFTVKHVSTGVSVTMSMMSNSTMLMIKRALAKRIGRPEVIEFGRLVKEVDGSYESFSEGDQLGSNEVLLFMNASLEDNPLKWEVDEEEYKDAEARKNGGGSSAKAKPKAATPETASNDIEVRITALQTGITVMVKMDKSTTTAMQLKERLAEEIGKPDAVEGKVLRRNNDGSGYSSFKDDELIGNRTALHFMGTDITPAKGSPADKKLRAQMKARANPGAAAKAKAKAAAAALPAPDEPIGDPEMVMITISHATNTKDKPVEVAVMNNLTILSVKEALAKKLKSPAVLQKGKFVQKKGMSSFTAVRDTEVIGSRKALLFMGMDLK